MSRVRYEVDASSGSSDGRRVKLPGKVRSEEVLMVDTDGREIKDFERLIFWELVGGIEQTFTVLQAPRVKNRLRQ